MKFRSAQLAAVLVLALSPALSVAGIDLDGDGVPDERDECPQTPEKTPVDARGCPLKLEPQAKSEPQPKLEAESKSELPPAPSPTAAASEAPGCATPPPGAIIDSFGCAVDEDADGVPDGLDRCPHTVQGGVVDARGCPLQISKEAPASDKTGKAPSAMRAAKKHPATAAASAAALPEPAPTKPETALSKLVQQDAPEKADKSSKIAPAAVAPAPLSAPVPAAVAGESSPALTVSFAAGSAELSSDAQHKLDLLARRVVEAATSKPNLKLELQAHSNAADGAAAGSLAQDRLDIVRVYLLAQGVDRGRFAPLANRPDQAGSGEGRTHGSRVEIRLIE